MDFISYFYNPFLIIPFIIYNIIPIIWKYLNKKKYSVKLINKNNNNDLYTYALIAIDKTLLKHKVCLTSYSTSKYISKNYREYSPVYEFFNSEIEIDGLYFTNGYFEENKRTVEYLLLESNDYKKIDNFMNNINNKAGEYFKSIKDNKDNKYHIFDEEWKEYDINVDKTFNNIFLPLNIRNKILEILDSFKNSKIYEIYGIPKKLGLLFYGLPGTGKTSLSFAISNYLKYDIYNLNCKTSKDIFYSQIRRIPEKSIIVINDVDILNINREPTYESKNISLKDLLEVFDGYTYFKECIVILTTNNIEKLDSALIRPGRIDHKIEFTYATQEQINNILATCDIKLKINKQITTSELINNIILPYFDNKKKIIEELKNF